MACIATGMPRPSSVTSTPPSSSSRDIDLVGVTGHRLVDRVVDDLPDQVVQTALTGGADVHAGAFADRLQTLENGDRIGAVLAAFRRRLLLVRHALDRSLFTFFDEKSFRGPVSRRQPYRARHPSYWVTHTGAGMAGR